MSGAVVGGTVVAGTTSAIGALESDGPVPVGTPAVLIEFIGSGRGKTSVASSTAVYRIQLRA
jgi:hypothetical protein